ncbi:MAG TPA: tetratricopeptide repeat protein [Pilimelia sp.]|nr:tetratricopeptide repeat protein [Pilimelia sp.]
MSAPSPLAAVQRDARARREAGDLAGAIAVLAGALDGAKPALGEDHPDILNTAYQLAQFHREAAEPAAARRVLEEALAAGQRRFPEDDRLLLAMSLALGSVAEELGNRHEARRNFSRVARLGPAALGQDHWAVRAARDYLGEQATPPGPGPADPRPAEAQPAPPRNDPPAPRLAEPETPPPPTVDRFTHPDRPSLVAQPAERLARPDAPPPEPVDSPTSMLPTITPRPAPTTPGPHSAQPRSWSGDDRFRGSADQGPHGHAPDAYPHRTRPPDHRPHPQASLPDLGPQPQISAPPAYPPVGYPQEIYPTLSGDGGNGGGMPAAGAVRRGRGATVAAVVAAVAAVIAVAVAGVIALQGDDAPPPNTATSEAPQVSVTAEPPADVRVERDAEAVVLTWVDPAPGRTTALITAGQEGENMRVVGQLPAGAPARFRMHALNPSVTYCFQVGIVYSATEMGVARPVCLPPATATPGR